MDTEREGEGGTKWEIKLSHLEDLVGASLYVYLFFLNGETEAQRKEVTSQGPRASGHSWGQVLSLIISYSMTMASVWHYVHAPFCKLDEWVTEERKLPVFFAVICLMGHTLWHSPVTVGISPMDIACLGEWGLGECLDCQYWWPASGRAKDKRTQGKPPR